MRARHAEVTWEIFLDAFRRQYVPSTAQRKLRMEFLSLVQGNQSIDEYETRFISLGRYDLETMGSEDQKVQKFINRLRPDIRSRLAPFDVLTYEEVVHRA